MVNDLGVVEHAVDQVDSVWVALVRHIDEGHLQRDNVLGRHLGPGPSSNGNNIVKWWGLYIGKTFRNSSLEQNRFRVHKFKLEETSYIRLSSILPFIHQSFSHGSQTRKEIIRRWLFPNSTSRNRTKLFSRPLTSFRFIFAGTVGSNQ